MKNPDKLRVVPLAEDLAIQVYKATSSFPSSERFGLTAQMRRAAISIGSNVVEGCGQLGDRAFVAYLYRATGSANELQFQTRIASRLGYGREDELAALIESIVMVRKKVIKLTTTLR
jgi:four helix bundle protein